MKCHARLLFTRFEGFGSVSSLVKRSLSILYTGDSRLEQTISYAQIFSKTIRDQIVSEDVVKFST
jgi:hypothetical protein